MDRLPVFAWFLTLVGLIVLIMYFNAPIEEVLLSFDVGNTTTVEELAYVVDTLEGLDADATFFLSGDFALAHPELVRNLSASYEIACRGMTGSRLPELNDTRMAWEITECKRVLENITGNAIVGFRAPQTLIDERSYTVLEEAGYGYDASSFENLGWFSPPATIPELSLSSWGFIPLPWFKPLGDMGFFLMRWDKDARMSIAFTPANVNSHRGAFEYLLESYTDDEIAFVRHSDAIA